MVRLRVPWSCPLISQYRTISIPTWYDWEQNPKICHYQIWKNFNSNMVRLRVNLFIISILGVKHISIPTWYDWELYIILGCNVGIIFQFQHGTIERQRFWKDNKHLWWFQFQHGTIESVSCVALQAQELYFNSNMVRLREELARQFPDKFYLFQFQHGTIESWLPIADPNSPINFNSNMVRLRE